MQEHEAVCSCGQLRVRTEGDPVRVSMCHCLACQRRTGSAFGMQARWPKDRVEITGRSTEYGRISDDGYERTFRFCPDCGSTVFWTNEDGPDLIAVAITRSPILPSLSRPSLSTARDDIRGCRSRTGSRSTASFEVTRRFRDGDTRGRLAA